MSRKPILAVAIGALALAGISWANIGEFSDLDRDGDGRVTREEARSLSQEKWQKFDTDGDGVVQREEFNDGIFVVVDADGSGSIDRQEARMLEHWGVDDDFDSLDADADTSIARAEFDEAVGEDDGPFADWDLDSDDNIADNEWEDGFYGLFDGNDDDYIDENEWNTWNDEGRVASAESASSVTYGEGTEMADADADAGVEAEVGVTEDETVADTETYGAEAEIGVTEDETVAGTETYGAEAEVGVTGDDTMADVDTHATEDETSTYGESTTFTEDETTMAAADTMEELPRTASPLALIALLGASAAGAASLLRLRR